jgi:hypothetical protein
MATLIMMCIDRAFMCTYGVVSLFGKFQIASMGGLVYSTIPFEVIGGCCPCLPWRHRYFKYCVKAYDDTEQTGNSADAARDER